MKAPARSFNISCQRATVIALALYMAGSLLITLIVDHFIPTKELFYSWLLVFINAYIGIFIANQAVRNESIGFFAWALLGNAVRAGLFLAGLMVLVKLAVLNVQGFVLITMFGYLSFLAAEIYGLQGHTRRLSQASQCKQYDE